MILAAAAAAATGCAAPAVPPPDPATLYAAPSLPDNQVALVKNTKGGNWLFPYRVTVLTIDTLLVNYPRRGNGEWITDEPIRVAPGRHRLKVSAGPDGPVTVLTLFDFAFDAGQAYRIDRIGTFDQRAKVVNETTGEAVPIEAKPGDPAMFR
jgi:hypothetical protein